MHRALEFVMLAITFASMSVLGTHLLYQYHGIVSFPERENDAHYILNSIELALSKDELARLSDEYRLYNPSKFISYKALRDRIGAERSFRISLIPSVNVSIKVDSGTLVSSRLILNGKPLAKAEAKLFSFSTGSYGQFVGETNVVGEVRFSHTPSHAICIVHDNRRGDFGFAIYNMEKAKAFIENETVYLKQHVDRAFLASPFGIAEVNLARGSFSLKPYSYLYPLVIVLQDGDRFYYLSYPHLFSQGYAKGSQRSFDILEFGMSNFLLLIEV